VPVSPTGVIEQFLHPPLPVLGEELISTLFTGDGSLTRPRFPLQVDAFGLTTAFFTIPAGFGKTVGVVDVWEPRMVQIGVIQTLFSGREVVVQLEDIHVEGMPILFDVGPLATRIDFSIAPGLSVIFSWLVILG